MKLTDAHVIITGASGGLGQVFVKKLLQSGSSVVAGDIDDRGLPPLKSYASDPAKLLTAEVDISQEASVLRFMKQAFEWNPYCNVLVNNAGILRDGLLAKKESDGSVRTLPLTQWDKQLAVNLTGSYLLTREFVAALLQGNNSSKGVVINISSISSLGHVGQSAYSASKAGLDACTRTWAIEFAPMHVRVVGIAPGVVETPMLRRVSDEALATLRRKSLVGRMGTPDDIWLALQFAIECEYFCGRTLSVDGGASF